MRLLFCISPGRAGSHYLATLLGTAKNVSAYKEAKPVMAYEFVGMVNNLPLQYTFNQRRIKVEAIKQQIKRNPKDSIYCETNHMFIKTFYDVVINSFKESAEVIILRRNLPKVLKSFVDLGYFGHNEESLNWMTRPGKINSVFPLYKPFNMMNQYEKCISYLIDIECRALKFKKEFKNIKTYEIDVDKLNNIEQVNNFFNLLNIRATEKTPKLVGTIINNRIERKKEFNTFTTIEKCQEECKKYLQETAKNHIIVPNTIIW